MKYAYIALIALLLVIFGLEMRQGGKAEQLADMRHTYAICMKAHGETNGKSEEDCGNAQDRTHTEFLCNQAGYCWLEVK